MNGAKKSIHLVIPYRLYHNWVNARNLFDRKVTARLNELIEMDSYLSDEEKTMKELEFEITNQQRKVEVEQDRLIKLKIRLDELNKQYEDEDQMKLEDSIEKARLMKELIAYDN